MTDAEQPGFEGLALAAGRRPRRRVPGDQPLADRLPVARVCLDVAPAHLDRLFDYTVPAALDEAARPGVRIKARFAGRDVDGFVVARAAESDHDGALTPLRRVVSPEPVLIPDTYALCRAVADHYAGTLRDVLRLAVPARHARAERAGTPGRDAGTSAAVEGGTGAGERDPHPTGGAHDTGDTAVETGDGPTAGSRGPEPETDPGPWADYTGGAAFLRRLRAGEAPRAVWDALPGHDPSDAIGRAVHATLASGRGVVAVLPDQRDVDRLTAALLGSGLTEHSVSAPGDVVRLTAQSGPEERYASYVAALRGHVRVVVGTRAAAFAPLPNLGLLICWNDGEGTLREPRAPYPHAREVLRLRAELAGCAVLLGSAARTVQAHALVRSGWARALAAPRAVVRERAPRVRALTSVELAAEGAAGSSRLPPPAVRAARRALDRGPVLVQVPVRGYVPVLACTSCREQARCGACTGPLEIAGRSAHPRCAWCGTLAGAWHCPACGGTSLRSVRVGSERTADELGRAFPGVSVRSSGTAAASGILDLVPPRPALIVATPGSEPHVEGGYAAALILDAGIGGAGTGLDSGQDVLRRWAGAAALVRGAEAGGEVLLVGDGPAAPTAALVRWDPAGLADRELDERVELGFQPAAAVAAVTGERVDVQAFLDSLRAPDGMQVLGVVDRPADDGPGTLEPPVRAVLRAPLRERAALAATLSAALGARSARRPAHELRVQLDPPELL